MNETPIILAVDDNESFLRSIKKLLRLSGYSSVTLSSPQKVLSTIEENNFSAVLLDIQMPGITGLALTKEIQAKYPALPIIIVSGNGAIDMAVETIKLGAFDYIEKPVEHKRLIVVLEKALRHREIIDTREYFIKEVEAGYQFIGESPAIKIVKQDVIMLGKAGVRLLITGESGTGKEIVAGALHFHSHRKDKPFIKLNCASIPSELLESELFGHKKGSFTGAVFDRPGKFQTADGGTFFLDEIAEMSIALQAKLLRVLEEGEIQSVGSDKTKKVDVRIIAATNKDLKNEINEGRFREDLFHRLNVAQIHVPPLRERKEDIIPLSYFFIQKFNNEYNKQVLKFSTQAEGVLKNHEWKGNVRELRNFIENLIIYSKNQVIELEDIMYSFERFGQESKIKPFSDEVIIDLKSAKNNFEKEYIKLALETNNWKISETAEILQVDRSNLHRKIAIYNLKKD